MKLKQRSNSLATNTTNTNDDARAQSATPSDSIETASRRQVPTFWTYCMAQCLGHALKGLASPAPHKNLLFFSMGTKLRYPAVETQRLNAPSQPESRAPYSTTNMLSYVTLNKFDNAPENAAKYTRPSLK